MNKTITRTVWLLSMVSLFTDMASEMLYPVMPVYLREIGFSLLWIGILEGCAEAIAGLSKSYFGALSDRSGKRLPFIQWGYGLSAISKPMMAIFTFKWWIFGSRTLDRLGKGLRTGARDALLSSEANDGNKATVFGFHRSMDTIGAVIGPALALLFLYFYPGKYQWLFYLAFLPGILAILCTSFIHEKQAAPSEKKPVSFLQAFDFWKRSGKEYRRVVIGLLLFALFNSSDLLLLLKIKESGHSDSTVIAIYIFYNLVFALLAWPVGRLADKLGLKKIFLTGLVFFMITYLGFAVIHSFTGFIILFICYGIYAAATEGIAKAWISITADKRETATAIGTYTGFQSIAALFASSFAGWLWYQFGPDTAFLSSGIVCGIVIIYFLLQKNTRTEMLHPEISLEGTHGN